MDSTAVIKGLDASQIEAVTTTEGSLILLAGPGSGKTETLVRRAAHIILSGTPGDRVLLMTFTNNAARENANRIEKFLRDEGYDGPLPIVGTFHHICLTLLREYAEYSKTIADDEASMRVLRSVTATDHFRSMYQNGANGLQFEGKTYLHVNSSRYDLICRLKDSMITTFDFATHFKDRDFSDVYTAYEAGMFKENMTDFGGIILDFADELMNNQDFFDTVTDMFDYVMVDEAHDSNLANLWAFRQISSKKDNIAIVCDDDQQIYAWRGADEKFLENFRKTFPNAKELVLNVNYRSYQEIVDASSNLISHNSTRQQKSFVSSAGSGGNVTYHLVPNIWGFGRRAAEIIHSEDIKDTAILARRRIEAYTISDILIQSGIKTKIVGLSTASRKEFANKLISYLTLLLDPNHRPSLLTAMQTIPGIGPKTAENFNGNWFEVDTKSKKLAQFYDVMRILYLKTTNEDRLNFIIHVIDPNDERDHVTKRFIDSIKWSKKSLLGIMDSLRLITEDDTTRDGDEVQVMTIHGAKGLEFERVIVAGATDLSIKGNIEEERRLAYVAMTRAKRDLHVMGNFTDKPFNTTSRVMYPPFQILDDANSFGISPIPQFIMESMGCG